MENIQPHETMQKFTIDPEGDVHLSLRDRELLVSSKVLSLASPVFKKLFGPHFSEGSRVEAKNPGHVDLHDDDPEAMTSLCYLLHYQMDNVADNPSLDFLHNVAVIADKYDCVRSISKWAYFHLSEAARQSAPSSSNGRLLSLTNQLDDPRTFREITKRMVYSVNINTSFLSTSDLWSIPNALAETLPVGLLGKARTSLVDPNHC